MEDTSPKIVKAHFQIDVIFIYKLLIWSKKKYILASKLLKLHYVPKKTVLFIKCLDNLIIIGKLLDLGFRHDTRHSMWEIPQEEWYKEWNG